VRFKIDENLPRDIAGDLRKLGHEAETVVEEGLTGKSDQVILHLVEAETRVLLTMDKGIADVRAYPPQNYAGIVLFRPRTAGRTATLTLVRSFLPTLVKTDPSGRLFVVSEAGIRIRSK
jgi:predicted nuclease of predicted toxin-antitoxin system